MSTFVLVAPVLYSVGDTKFSHDRGFYETPFEVILTTATPGATIIYTTDGSKPSVSHGIVGNKVLVDKTTVLRVMAFRASVDVKKSPLTSA